MILLNFYFTNNRIMHKGKQFLASFGNTKHVNSEGQPSKYDGDYHSYTLVLYDDKTFLYTYQYGRLKPHYKKESGNWQISNETLITEATELQFTDFPTKEFVKGYKNKTIYILKNNRLCDEFANMCLQNRKGLPAWKLFKDY